MRSTIYTF